MEIFEGIFTINGFRAIFIKKLNAITISDLRLGEGLYLAEQGIFAPLNSIKKKFKNIF